ncbi:MAG TPA: hypothetical protein VK157_13740, partial [Phycisphaerales bacterium]|nr:hypothetical protein [Phycisphaerales bacterium]
MSRVIFGDVGRGFIQMGSAGGHECVEVVVAREAHHDGTGEVFGRGPMLAQVFEAGSQAMDNLALTGVLGVNQLPYRSRTSVIARKFQIHRFADHRIDTGARLCSAASGFIAIVVTAVHMPSSRPRFVPS